MLLVGLELALACDVRVAGERARFGMPETARGMVPMGGGTQRLPRLIGQQRANLMFYTGDAFPAWKGNLFVGSAQYGEVRGTGHLQRVVLNENFEDIRRERLLDLLAHLAIGFDPAAVAIFLQQRAEDLLGLRTGAFAQEPNRMPALRRMELEMR